jgi:hypothetical protein
MDSGWTLERRARQSALIRTWKPWEKSTGPRSAKGKAKTARNGFTGGQRGQLRELTKAVSQLLRKQRSALAKARG